MQKAYAQMYVTHAEIDSAKRSVSLTLTSEVYIKQSELNEMIRQLQSAFALENLQAKITYPSELLESMDLSELAHLLVQAYPPAIAILARAKWEYADGMITIHLAANGKDELQEYLPRLQQRIKELFGVEVQIELISTHTMSAEELFALTAQMRMEAMKHAPAPIVCTETKASAPKKEDSSMIFGRPFRGEVVPMRELNLDMFRVCVEGKVFAVQHRELKKRNAWVVCFDVTDYTGSVRINQFMEPDKAKPILDGIKVGMWVRIQGKMTFDRYDNEMVMQPNAIEKLPTPTRTDTAEEKRVELHLHTTMSSMDALTVTGAAVKRAASWGHRAIAITDHGCAHSFPDAMMAAGKAKVAGTGEPIKILYGCEGYYVNDVDAAIAVKGGGEGSFDQEYVAFDIETTGLSAKTEVLIELGAVIMRRGEIVDRFDSFVAPNRPIPPRITELTGITDAMVADAPAVEDVLPKFLEFCGDRPLCAHNAEFDVGFVKEVCRQLGLAFDPVYFDTLALARNLMPQLGRYKLNIVADALSLPDFNHHRASDDAITCGYMLARFFTMLEERGITSVEQINPEMSTMCHGVKLAT
ncbi:MAG: PHP domain-containing protein, partial [Oscillospiraceae bacterium]|nr:PHP domain-containing protein [Oscillospiraceae bacterium]